MFKRVSVIIPNYNAGRYIDKCINSVLNQTYKNIELIIIDDGSIDESLNIIKEYSNKYKNILVMRQQNLNASIARNRGIENASGRYLMFIDSDDILYPDAIKKMVEIIEKDESDMVIGNFYVIDERDILKEKCIFTEEDRVEDKPIILNKIAPNPSNKLYRLDIIEKYNIVFGNVRIGQDLNFYLKYLLKCKKISLVSDYIYGWRYLQGSMSNKASFRIFDITESFKDIRNFYIKENAKDIYENYIKMIEYRHYYLQMEKQIYFDNRKDRKLVVDYFTYYLKRLNVKSCLNFDENKSDYKKCILKIRFSILYKSFLYRNLLQVIKNRKQKKIS